MLASLPLDLTWSLLLTHSIVSSAHEAAQRIAFLLARSLESLHARLLVALVRKGSFDQ